MHRIESGKRQYAQYAVISPIGFIALATVLAPASRAVAFPCSRRGTHRASARERAYKFVKYWPARSSALAFVARSVLQGENGTRSDVCRELFVHSDAAVPFSPFPPRSRPALPRPRYRFSFSVFATAKCHCFWRRALELRCSFNATRTARLSRVRSALVRLAACRGWNDGKYADG